MHLSKLFFRKSSLDEKMQKKLKKYFIILFLEVPTDESVSNGNCTFPDWALEMGPMKSLTYTSHYEFSQGKQIFSNFMKYLHCIKITLGTLVNSTEHCNIVF